MHDEHFKAGVVVEMGVTGGDHQFMVSVLQVSQLVGDAVRVVVIDQGDGSYHRDIRLGDLFDDQFFANEIAKGLGTIGIALAADETIESFQEN